MTSNLAALPIVTEPVWPWSEPYWGWIALAVTGLFLIALTVLTYVRVPSLSFPRALALLIIRMLALGIIFVSLLGVSCVAWKTANRESLIVIVVDGSASMANVRDEKLNGESASRWERTLHELRKLQPLIEKLKEDHRVQVRFVKFAKGVDKKFHPDNPGNADVLRTNHVQMLQEMLREYRNHDQLRAMIVMGDGADNALTEKSPFDLARDWQRENLGPILVIALGDPATPDDARDVILHSLTPPSSVPVKGTLPIEVTLEAGAFKDSGRSVRVRAFIDDKEVTPEEVQVHVKSADGRRVLLHKQKLNVVKLERATLFLTLNCAAPPTPGEIKVTLKVEDARTGKPFENELSAANNEISTFVSVTKEGVSVLLIERQERFPEPQILLPVLERDKRIRAYRVWIRGNAGLNENQKDLFDFKRRPYDVIILGDVSARRLTQTDPKLLETIREKVAEEGVGLLMMGGRYTFGNKDEQGGDNWKDSPLKEVLPIDFSASAPNSNDNQHEGKVYLVPENDGLSYVLRIGDTADDSRALWEKLPPLNGATKLGMLKTTGNVQPFATIKGSNELLLVTQDYGKGRVMAFGGDTTYLWRSGNPETGLTAKQGREAHVKFWRRMVLWLARQDEQKNDLVIEPEDRRIPIGAELKFNLRLLAKDGQTIPIDDFKVERLDPGKKKETDQGDEIPRDPTKDRVVFVPKLPGEYVVKAEASGVDPTTKEKVTKSTSMRFLTYRDDAETTKRSANHQFLRRLTKAGGGEMIKIRDKDGKVAKDASGRDKERLPYADDLEYLLRKYGEQPPVRDRTEERTPDWRTSEKPSPFFIGFFLVFVQLLTLEWFLRRRWGLK